jgi:N-acetylmuramoyl-L-alanine amidase
MINQTTNQTNNPRTIKNIVVHCTATPQSTTIESIERYWRENLKWKRPGYHYIVKPDGTVVSMLPETMASNGVEGHNQKSIHISYIGGVDAGGKPKDNRTSHQKNVLFVALRFLKQKYPNAVIVGHRDFPGVTKDCPSFDAKKEYSTIK